MKNFYLLTQVLKLGQGQGCDFQKIISFWVRMMSSMTVNDAPDYDWLMGSFGIWANISFFNVLELSLFIELFCTQNKYLNKFSFMIFGCALISYMFVNIFVTFMYKLLVLFRDWIFLFKSFMTCCSFVSCEHSCCLFLLRTLLCLKSHIEL